MEPTATDFQYIIPVDVTRRKTDAGKWYITVNLTEEVVMELKSAERNYIRYKEENFNAGDSVDVREMKVSEQIENEIHQMFRILRPSDDVKQH